MEYILVEWSKGATLVRSKQDTGSDDQLTEHEQIINELYSKIKNEKKREYCTFTIQTAQFIINYHKCGK